MTSITTLREKLNQKEFDWNTGKIIVQFPYRSGYPDICDGDTRKYILFNDPILDLKFDAGFGAPEMPLFIAEDALKLYFPTEYDGATGVRFIFKDINHYLDINEEMIYS